MTRSVSLRPWQREALEKFERRKSDSFLAVACPGAGKTTFALVAARTFLAGERRPVLVIVPTAHLKHQWADAAAQLGVHLEPEWSASDGRIPADMHGIVITYAQAGIAAKALAPLVRNGFVVLDEVHHAASERTWGTAVEIACSTAACRLLLSGTPFRTDDNPIPFVEYTMGDHGDAVAHYQYGYGEALVDGGVVRPVYFPRFDGHMEWVGADGELREGSFEDDLDRDHWGARLRTALAADGGWLATVLDHAHTKLTEIRRTHADAGGLVIAMDHAHARAIADALRRRHGVEVAVVLSDDPEASARIARFAAGTSQWIVAVRMISEGVDIPRLRVGVFATNTTTDMFFRQAVGRITRWTKGITNQRAYMYLPDDVRLRALSSGIADQRRHSIKARTVRHEDPLEFDALPAVPNSQEQMSLFAPVSSTVLGEAPPTDVIDESPADDGESRIDGHGLLIDLPPPPPLPGRSEVRMAGGGSTALLSRGATKKQLRLENSESAKVLAALTGLTHAQVNRELNRMTGLVSINDATLEQLETRVRHARSWQNRVSA